MLSKELFLQKMSELADKLESDGIALWELDKMITKNLNIPDEEEWEIIRTELNNIGLKIFDENSKYYGFQIFTYLKDYGNEGLSIEINIHNLSPFFVTIRAIDSYYNPQMDYEYGKTYIDDEQLFEDHPNFEELNDIEKSELVEEYTRDNDNWEPSEWSKVEITVNIAEEIWTWLREQIQKLKKEWED